MLFYNIYISLLFTLMTNSTKNLLILLVFISSLALCQEGLKPCNLLCVKGQHCENGKCVPDFKPCLELCKIGYHCVDGTCVPIDKCKDVICALNSGPKNGCCPSLCSLIICPPDTICKNGMCVPDIKICPVKSKYAATYCTDPRPDEKTCPTIYYIREPDPLFCGIKADGTRVNFPRQCEACKDTSIIYYFNAPCKIAPLVCKPCEICRGQACVSK